MVVGFKGVSFHVIWLLVEVVGSPPMVSVGARAAASMEDGPHLVSKKVKLKPTQFYVGPTTMTLAGVIPIHGGVVVRPWETSPQRYYHACQGHLIILAVFSQPSLSFYGGVASFTHHP
jgi:hypothetical protein